jgi:spoIIIJ-associated protein
VAEGLRALGLTADQVEVEVVNKGSRGIFGLGSEPAVVRLQPRTATPPTAHLATTASATQVAPEPITDRRPILAEQPSVAAQPSNSVAEAVTAATPPVAEQASAPPAVLTDVDEIPITDGEVEEIAAQLLSETVSLMGFEATVETTWRTGNDDLSEHSDRYLLLDLQGGDLGALIGRRGEALDNLQYLLRLMKNIVVDVEGYKERRISQLKQLAQRTATQVAASGRPVALEPMPPNERRIIHLTLRDHADVYTESAGEGDRRKVQILSKNH